MTLLCPTRKHVPEPGEWSNIKIPTLLEASTCFPRHKTDSLNAACFVYVFIKAPCENWCINFLEYSSAFFSLYFTRKTGLGSSCTLTGAAETKVNILKLFCSLHQEMYTYSKQQMSNDTYALLKRGFKRKVINKYREPVIKRFILGQKKKSCVSGNGLKNFR